MNIMESVQTVSVSLPIALVQKIETCRKDISRSRFVHRLLEKGFELHDSEPKPRSNPTRNSKKHQKSFDKAPKAKNNALRKGTESQIKSKIEYANSTSPS